MTDFADLQASYFGYIIMVRPRMQYSPDDSGTSLQLVNNGLADVIEGGRAFITTNNLSVKMNGFKDFTFSIETGPRYGSIDIVDPQTGTVERRGVFDFTMSDIRAERVVYQNDGSEEEEDFFTFTATVILEDSSQTNLDDIQEFSGTFRINMRMVNDNPPVRSVDKVFKVATGQSKVLAITDLAFTDPDINFDDSLLHYQFESIANGDIINSVTQEVVRNFTQNDLIQRNLVFRHKGKEYSHTNLVVSDGKFATSSAFEIQASPPFIIAISNNVIVVEKGKTALISPDILMIESNMDFRDQDASILINTEPRYGQLKVSGRKVRRFSYR